MPDEHRPQDCSEGGCQDDEEGRGEEEDGEVRYFDIHEDDPLDEAKMATWIRRAAALPGWVP